MARKIPIEQQIVFIEEFKLNRTDFEDYADLIRKILNKAISELGLMGFAEARAKSIVSFSNKIIQKDKYKNPLTDVTDLCGARIVVHFKRQVDKVCEFIRENFEIDEANSLDAKSRLAISEFGYRSIHYIVSPKKDKILEIPVEDKFTKLKAEIQVRTLAEHIWADISHDRIYKTELNIPDEWKREAAELSAMLENADKKFAGMAAEIDSLANVYELQSEKKKAEIDILKLKTIISVLNDDNDECVKNCLKLSAIYRAEDNYTEAVMLLEQQLEKPLKSQLVSLKLRFEYAILLGMSCRNRTNDPDYMKGIRLIGEVIEDIQDLNSTIIEENKEIISNLYYRAGKFMQRNAEEAQRVTGLFTRAHDLMPGNPLYLVAMMESVILGNLNTADYNVSLFKSNISDSIAKLNELINIGVDRLPALFALGHCYLFLNDEEKCIDSYARAVQTLLSEKYISSRESVGAEIALTGLMKSKSRELAEEAKLYLNIAMYLVSDESLRGIFINSIHQYRVSDKTFKKPVVIIAGGAARMDVLKVDDYRPYIHEAMLGFRGTIISGGTTSGIPGLAGMVKGEISKNGPVMFDLESYLPGKLPADAEQSPFYDSHHKTPSKDFSALDVLVCWADLICNGVNPKDVTLIGIEGGKISTMEYKIALSLGAKVAIIAYSGGAATDITQDKNWKDCSNLITIPNDPMTLWAFVNQWPFTQLNQEEIDSLARKAHDSYRKMELPKFRSESENINDYKVLMPWENLNESLRSSNQKQVAFYEVMLARVGLKIRKVENPAIVDLEQLLKNQASVISEELTAFDTLAMLEHARWNAERLLDGWRYGPVKDIARKINPCLVPWTALNEQIKLYDYEPVKNIPTFLASIGYEIFKP